MSAKMKMTATPGPWDADRMDHPHEDAWGVYAADPSEYADPGDVCAVATYLTEADARLIAQAPALAAALRACVEHHDHFLIATIGAEMHRKYGDPPAIAEARKVLKEIDND